MQALVLRGHGDLSMLELTEVPSPQITGPGDVLIALETAALNHLDLHTVSGIPGLKLKFPHILGGDGAGTVVEVGDAVRNVKPDDQVLFNPGISCYDCDMCLAGEHSLCVRYRLLGEHVPGTLAEYIVVPHHNVACIPSAEVHPAIGWEEAAAFSLATLTAWRMLVTRARVRPGETVLIWGVGGGVASAALSIAKLLGAFVIVTSSDDDKLNVAKDMGADAALRHDEIDVAREVRTLTNKRGADVVVDNVGEATWSDSLRALGKLGRLVTCGGTTGPNVVTDVRRLFWNQYDILGSTMGNAKEYCEIIRLLGQGRLRSRVDSVFPLARGVEALERMQEGKQMGKIVVKIRDGV